MTECSYYGDLTTLNVFVATEILKCHIQSFTGLEKLDYKFNSYSGNILKLNSTEHFNANELDAVIGMR